MAEQPDWQPISRLSLIGSMIDGMLQDAEEHYQTLLQAAPKPHVLDDYTVDRVFEVFGRQKEDLPSNNTITPPQFLRRIFFFAFLASNP
jgi:hypothetical protein